MVWPSRRLMLPFTGPPGSWTACARWGAPPGRCVRSRPESATRRRRPGPRSRAARRRPARSAERSRARASGNRRRMATSCGMSMTKITSLARTASAPSGDAACPLRSTLWAMAIWAAVGCGGRPATAASPADITDTPAVIAERLLNEPRGERAPDDVALTHDQNALRGLQRRRSAADGSWRSFRTRHRAAAVFTVPATRVHAWPASPTNSDRQRSGRWRARVAPGSIGRGHDS